MFSTENLRFTFPENGITAVDGVSIEFEAGKIHALLGENGAGKSTLARLCTGHLQPDGGRILYNGEALDLRSAADGIAGGLVLTPQHPQLSAELTVWENLITHRKRYRRQRSFAPKNSKRNCGGARPLRYRTAAHPKSGNARYGAAALGGNRRSAA